MILLCFAGCAEKTGEEVKSKIGEEASADAVTLSLYLMSEQPVSEKQEKLMEEKVNELTEAKYNIHIDLVYNTPDVYYTKLEANLKKMNDYYKDGNVGKNEGEPVYTDENGLPAIYYPPIEEFDVDIFYFGGYDKYLEYKNNGYLKNIDEQMTGSAKALKAVINKTLVDEFFAINGGYDAIPVNRTIGEYTYILLNKDVLDDTQYSTTDITSLVCDNCQDLLDMVSKEMDEYVPLYSELGELSTLGVEYFSTDESGLPGNDFSILGGTYNSTWVNKANGSYPVMGSILNSADNGNLTVKEQINVLKNYSFNGYYGTEEDAEKPFAVGYVTGGPEVLDIYGDDYEIVIAGMPTLEHEDVYEHLFAVSNYTNSVTGSTEILTYINTDPVIRNLLLYGVEGENYVWEDSAVLDANGNAYRVVARQTKDPEKLYVMDAAKTGNVALAYVAADEDPSIAKLFFDHNDNLVVDYIAGFSFYEGLKTEKIDQASFDALKALGASSAEIYAKIEAAEDQEALDAAWAELEALAESDNYKKVMSTEAAEGATSTSPYSYYMSWLIEKGLEKAPETAE